MSSVCKLIKRRENESSYVSIRISAKVQESSMRFAELGQLRPTLALNLSNCFGGLGRHSLNALWGMQKEDNILDY